MSHNRKTERGQALILIALAAIGLFAFSALAIDGTRNFSNKRHAQNAADTSVLAAALKYIRTGSIADAKTAARDRATSNGYTHGTSTPGHTSTRVYVNLCSEEGTTDPDTGWVVPPCEGIETAHKDQYIRVRIVDEIPATFGRVIGRQTLTTAAEAIARVQGSSASSTGGSAAGAAMVATNDTNDSHCFLFNGNATLITHDSGIFVNCKSSDALFLNGNSKFTMDADSYVAGCKDGNPGYEIIGGKKIICNAPQIPINASTYAGIATMPPVPSCSTYGTIASEDASADYNLNIDYAAKRSDLTLKDGTVTINPGGYDSIIINKGTLNMKPGVYCVNGNFTVNGSSGIIKGASGTVTIVMKNADFGVGSGLTYTFDGLEIFTNDSSLDLKGTLKTELLRFYSSGSGSVKINSGSSVTSNDAYIYLDKGGLVWNGSTTVKLKAPTYNPYNGILIHTPWTNKSDINLNGGSSAVLYGTVLTPQSKVTINGGNNFELHGQIIAYTYILDGDGNVEIYYLASPLITPPAVANPSIQLTR